MTNSSWVRGDLTAPTTPEQCHAALQRQERVIDSLRKERDELASQNARLRETLDRFADSGAADCIGRGDYSVMRERIKDWLGVSDFKMAATVMAETPAVSLAHVRAEAIDYAVDQCEFVQYGQCQKAIEVETILKLARSIRQSTTNEGGAG